MARILVVDDDPSIRMLLHDVLNWEGYAVETATNGQEGLAMVEDAKPDLVLLDLMMPVMDGWEVYRRLRTGGSAALPIIIITAGTLLSRAQRDFPDAQVVGKPFDLDTLLETIQSYLTNRRHPNGTYR